MDLDAARHMNSPTWKGIRLMAIVFFAIAGALLVASLVAPTGVRAEAGLGGHAPTADAAPPLRFATAF